MSSAACSPPFFSCAPKDAFGPVIGPPMPSLICAWAAPERARPKPSAMPANSRFFISELPWVVLSGCEARPGRSRRGRSLACFRAKVIRVQRRKKRPSGQHSPLTRCAAAHSTSPLGRGARARVIAPRAWREGSGSLSFKEQGSGTPGRQLSSVLGCQLAGVPRGDFCSSRPRTPALAHRLPGFRRLGSSP